jgi:hypothetical protein
MKTKKINSKLSLTKTTIANLNRISMDVIKGGDITIECITQYCITSYCVTSPDACLTVNCGTVECTITCFTDTCSTPQGVCHKD